MIDNFSSSSIGDVSLTLPNYDFPSSFPSNGLYMIDSRWSSAACVLVRRVTVIVGKIAAHPTDLAQLLISVAVEDLKVGGINESVIVSVDLNLRIWMQRCAAGHGLENRFNCESELVRARSGGSQGELTSFHPFRDDFKFSHRSVVIIPVGPVLCRRFIQLAVDAWARLGAGDGVEGYRGIFDLKAAPSGGDER